ncbi:hypothetical protein ACVILJ_002439 [Bradyrhizobium diazoefficiens]
MTRMMLPVTTGGNSGSSRRDEGCGDDAEQAGGDDGAVDAEQADIGRGGHREHRPDRSKRHAHHHGQADADAGEAEALHQRRKPAGEQVGADQEGDVLRRQLQRASDDQRHRDRAGIHHQHMLEPEREQARDRQDFVDGMDLAAHE